MNPIFLFRDEEKKHSLIQSYKKQIDVLNRLKMALNEGLKTTLTKEELERLATNPKQWVNNRKAEIKSIYPFASADNDFNQKALGISYIEIDKVLQELTDNEYQYLLNEMVFEVNESYIEELEKQADVYARTEDKILKVELAEQVASGLSKMLETGLIDIYFLKPRLSGIIRYDGYKNSFIVDKKNAHFI